MQPIPITKQDCLDITQNVEEGFQRYGLSVSPLSDIAKFIQETKWLAQHVRSNPEKLTKRETDKWVNAFLRLQQMKNISSIFSRLKNTNIPVQKLQILQKKLDYLNQTGNSNAPNIWFELEVAGRIARQYPGLNVLFREPDIVIENPEGQIALSCKKLKSEQQLRRRLSEAADQGRIAELPFFVIVDLQEIIQHKQGSYRLPLLHASSQKDLELKCSTFLDELIVKHLKATSSALSKGAGGVIFCARCVGLVLEPLSLCWCLRHKSCPNLAIPSAADVLDSLVKLMEQ